MFQGKKSVSLNETGRQGRGSHTWIRYIAASIPDVGLFGGLPWRDATLARIPEKQMENGASFSVH